LFSSWFFSGLAFVLSFFGVEDVARKFHSPRRGEVSVAACGGGARRKAGQPEAVARRPGVAAARASKGSGPVACTTSRLLLVALGPSYDVDFPLVKLQKNPVPLQAPRRIAVEEGDCVVPPPPIRCLWRCLSFLESACCRS